MIVNIPAVPTADPVRERRRILERAAWSDT